MYNIILNVLLYYKYEKIIFNNYVSKRKYKNKLNFFNLRKNK